MPVFGKLNSSRFAQRIKITINPRVFVLSHNNYQLKEVLRTTGGRSYKH